MASEGLRVGTALTATAAGLSWMGLAALSYGGIGRLQAPNNAPYQNFAARLPT
jgi:hypothetical protein